MWNVDNSIGLHTCKNSDKSICPFLLTSTSFNMAAKLSSVGLSPCAWKKKRSTQFINSTLRFIMLKTIIRTLPLVIPFGMAVPYWKLVSKWVVPSSKMSAIIVIYPFPMPALCWKIKKLFGRRGGGRTDFSYQSGWLQTAFFNPEVFCSGPGIWQYSYIRCYNVASYLHKTSQVIKGDVTFLLCVNPLEIFHISVDFVFRQW